MAKLVRDAMTANPRTLRVEATVLDAARLMEEEDVGSIPVVDGAILVGMITDRDIVLRVVAAGADPATTTVETVATRDISPAHPDESLDEALRQMAQRQVRRLPVIDADRVVVGILAQADVAQEATAKKAGQLVEEISQPSEPPGQH